MNIKELSSISWNVDESTYRKDPAISYSTLSVFAREGFKGLQRVLSGEKITSSALEHGSMVDTLLTDVENFNNIYFIADFDKPSDVIKNICDNVWQITQGKIDSLKKVNQDILLACINAAKYGGSNWKTATKIDKVINEGGDSYFKLLGYAHNKNKIIAHRDDYIRAEQCVNTLKTHPFTAYVFDTNDPNIKIYYQLKFKMSLGKGKRPLHWQDNFADNECIRCMFDIIRVNYKEKWIEPIDLKTTGKDESNFENSMADWYYDLQATKYSYILRSVCACDEYFKGFIIKPFSFMVINKFNLTPLIYVYPDSVNNTQNEFRDYLGRKHKPWYAYLNDVRWHIKNNQFSYSKEAITNNGKINVKFYD